MKTCKETSNGKFSNQVWLAYNVIIYLTTNYYF